MRSAGSTSFVAEKMPAAKVKEQLRFTEKAKQAAAPAPAAPAAEAPAPAAEAPAAE